VDGDVEGGFFVLGEGFGAGAVCDVFWFYAWVYYRQVLRIMFSLIIIFSHWCLWYETGCDAQTCGGLE
jgi:hypothetical protein